MIDRAAVRHNVRILRQVADDAGMTILLALKAFALPAIFDLVREHLDGVCASGVYEARLGHEEIALPVHTYAPAYTPDDLDAILSMSDHVSFNSLGQWVRHRDACRASQRQRPELKFGIRVNPEFSVGDTELYDPCAPYSRLGTTVANLEEELASHADAWEGISGLHFHTLCENDSYALEATLTAVEERFGEILRKPQITWLNIGGGHHITKSTYDRAHLRSLVERVRSTYNVDVIAEPGEAAAIHSGVLVTSVVDTTRNGMELAILDTSATAHMPDTLEMPYRADIWGAGGPIQYVHRYRLGGQTCLAGDVIGDYSFAEPLEIGDRLVFDDMSHYTMVKTTTFNGIALPAIATWDSDTHELAVHRRGEYGDFRDRLG